MLYYLLAAPASPTKTLHSVGPIIVVILIVAAAFLGYFQLIYYPTIAPHSSITTSSTSSGPPEKVVTIVIPYGAQNQNTPSSQTYLPNAPFVYIGYNASVRWINNDTTVHTVTADGTPPDPKFSAFAFKLNNIFYNGSDSTPLSLNFTFTVPGIYNYSCTYHIWMKGSVIVKNAPPGLINSTTIGATNIPSTKSSAVIVDRAYLVSTATAFAKSLATLIGSGTEPWRVNLSNSLFATESVIPAVLTKTS